MERLQGWVGPCDLGECLSWDGGLGAVIQGYVASSGHTHSASGAAQGVEEGEGTPAEQATGWVSSRAMRSSAELDLRLLGGRGPRRRVGPGLLSEVLQTWPQHPGPWGALLTSGLNLCPCSPNLAPGGALGLVLGK